MAVLKVNTAFEVKGSQLSHGSGNILGIRFPSAYTVHGHTETCLTSNQIKFVGVCYDFSIQGNVNELPRNKSWDFKCVHASVLTLRWSAESCPTAIRLLMTGLH